MSGVWESRLVRLSRDADMAPATGSWRATPLHWGLTGSTNLAEFGALGARRGGLCGSPGATYSGEMLARLRPPRFGHNLRIRRGVTGQEPSADAVAVDDAALAVEGIGRVFAQGSRPVMRWIKADGLDDDVTRAALGAATRVFGGEVDYCLCTVGLEAARVRDVLAWAAQPVEWWPVGADDNPQLAARLTAADCAPEDFGYWWKWFPERARPAGPEWILDGDMVVVGRPPWFETWADGSHGCRISQDDSHRYANIYGQYERFVSKRRWLYSGLVSLPPGTSYMREVERILDTQPLVRPHNGRTDMSEQGVIAAAFHRLKARPFPLSEFPFARAFEEHLDFGLRGDRGVAWGYHFGNAFKMANPHFADLVANGTIFSREAPSLVERFAWLGNIGQWGVPGWSLNDECTEFILDAAAACAGSDVLEIGTPRGRMTAMLATLGCRVTTVDHVDRGAGQNLAGLDVSVIRADAATYLEGTDQRFPFVVVDLHGNSEATWRRLFPLLERVVIKGGRIAVNNLTLSEIPQWRAETGVAWLIANLPAGFSVESRLEALPGVVILRRSGLGHPRAIAGTR